jgi:hypothetical protein
MDDRTKAVKLRKRGKSLTEICKELSRPKGTIYYWIRDINLSDAQKDILKRKRVTLAVKKMAEWHKEDRKKRWSSYQKEAELLYPKYKDMKEFIFGIALYAGEGGKSNWIVDVSNTNIEIIKATLRFYQVIGIDFLKIRVMVSHYKNNSDKKVVDYWSNQIGIAKSQFYNCVHVVSRSEKGIQDAKYPYGTCRISVLDTRLKQMVKRWTELMFEDINS